jgi:glutamate 5-kinase
MKTRKDIIKKAKKIILKIGSTALIDSEKKLNPERFKEFAEDIDLLKREGRIITVVSSGAIAGGVSLLGLNCYPRSIEDKQAVAAIGQSYLMKLYGEAFSPYNIKIAQILLTHEDFSDRTRYVNAKHTLTKLFKMGIIPVVNENDTVSTEEIKIGDNDTLSAKLTGIVDADILIILSDIDGLYDRDPKKFPDARFIPLVEEINEEWLKFASDSKNTLSVGGMRTKIEAAIIACSYGAGVLIANGMENHVLRRIFSGEEIGTLFKPRFTDIPARKFWIGFTLKPKGEIIIDQGAKKAIMEGNKSLLPRGIKGVTGHFEKNDTVRVVTEKGYEIARGITNYSSTQIKLIAGVKTSEIEKKLGFKGPDEVIHRDDMLILRKE